MSFAYYNHVCTKSSFAVSLLCLSHHAVRVLLSPICWPRGATNPVQIRWKSHVSVVGETESPKGTSPGYILWVQARFTLLQTCIAFSPTSHLIESAIPFFLVTFLFVNDDDDDCFYYFQK